MVECLDGPARITSKELAPIHSVKNGIPQNACSTSPGVVADLEKSALMRIARLTNSLAKGAKRMVTKVRDPLYTLASRTSGSRRISLCDGVGDVIGVEAPLGGVAQVIFHGVQVVEVGVQVRVHQDRGEEEDGEGQVEVEREVEEVREKRTYTWRGDETTDT